MVSTCSCWNAGVGVDVGVMAFARVGPEKFVQKMVKRTSCHALLAKTY